MKSFLYKLVDEPTESVFFPKGQPEPPCSTKIPMKLALTWEENSFGSRHAKSLRELVNLNPDIDFDFFDAEKRDQYISDNAISELRELYFATIYRPMRVDIFRYLYVLNEGGHYLDISMGWNRPVSTLGGENHSGIIAFEKNKSVFHAPPESFPHVKYPLNLAAMWGFGFKQGHPILSHALEYILKRYPAFCGVVCKPPKAAIVSLTGPAAFTYGVWMHLKEEDPDLKQYDFDFGDVGYRHRGAGYRHRQHSSYALVPEGQILPRIIGSNS